MIPSKPLHSYFEVNSYRRRILLGMLLTIAIGLFSRLAPIGFPLWDKYLGDTVYALFFYLICSVLFNGSSALHKAGWTALYVTAIEVLQLTGIPLQLNRSDNPVIRLFAYLVLGSTFSWWDLLAYAVGIVIAVLLDNGLWSKRP
jgi:hypothetical protein